jgi:1,2-diacylglycerol 3-alpha-glucosyltransferase
MTIGIFTDSYLPLRDGVATSVASSAASLEKKGHTVYIIAPESTKYGEYEDAYNVYRLRSYLLYREPEIRIGLQLPQRSLLKISTIDFDIIHGHACGPISILGWELARLRRIPFIATYHTLWKYYRYYFPFSFMRKPHVLEKMSSIFGNQCDIVVAPTEKVKRELLSYGIHKPIRIIPNGIDIEKFSAQQQGFLHKKLSIPHKKKIILSVGRLGEEKSIDFLIHSFAAYAHSVRSDAVLVLVGEGKDKAKLESLAAESGILDRIYFTGAIAYTDMPQVYADADLFVFASQTETQGMVLLEALASGIPVLAVEDSAFVNIVKHNVNGMLVTKDTQLFASTMGNLLADMSTLTTFHKNAKNSVLAYSVENSTMSLESLYSETLFDTSMQQRIIDQFFMLMSRKQAAAVAYLQNKVL